MINHSKTTFSLTAPQALSKHRVIQTLTVACILAFCIHGLWLILFWGEHALMSRVNAIAVLVYAICIYLLKSKYKAVEFVLWCAGLEQIVHQVLAIYYLGWDLGFQYYFLVLAAFSFLGHHKTMLFPFSMAFLSTLSFIASYYYHIYWYEVPAEPILSQAVYEFLNVSNIIFAFSAIAIISYIFSREAGLAEKNLGLEKEKSESLLLNILPASIAQKLKESTKTIADKHENVSVLFADIVGFSKISTDMPPDKLVGMLNNIFSHFDLLAENYGLEKIKTIGDAYMVASGLPEYTKDHLTNLTYMAIDMIDYLKKEPELVDLGLEVRVGMHIGPVVAGVIGLKKFTYDLWGDTVNTASRMESHGMPSRITVSEPVKVALEGQFEFEKRNVMYIKGKGEMQTYFLNKPTANPA